jgi:hypothetical protein
MKPPYLILHTQRRILSTPNSLACVFHDTRSKCKTIYRVKISAFAGMTKTGPIGLFTRPPVLPWNQNSNSAAVAHDAKTQLFRLGLCVTARRFLEPGCLFLPYR